MDFITDIWVMKFCCGSVIGLVAQRSHTPMFRNLMHTSWILVIKLWPACDRGSAQCIKTKHGTLSWTLPKEICEQWEHVEKCKFVFKYLVFFPEGFFLCQAVQILMVTAGCNSKIPHSKIQWASFTTDIQSCKSLSLQGPDQGHPLHKAVESQSALLPAFLLWPKKIQVLMLFSSDSSSWSHTFIQQIECFRMTKELKESASNRAATWLKSYAAYEQSELLQAALTIELSSLSKVIEVQHDWYGIHVMVVFVFWLTILLWADSLEWLIP